jgi:ribosomal protein S18 acetylase RimI-like enzyme
MKVAIRKARDTELKTVQDLNYALFVSDSKSDQELNMNWPYEDGKDYFKKMIEGSIGACFVAEVGGEVIGYLAGSIKAQTPSYRPVKRSELENMFVREEYRNKGIGEKLVKKFLSWSKENGISNTFVSAYSPNHGAIRYYERLGFKPYASELENENL